ncbi:hypothetical protein [Mesorhizobium sp. M7A.F.Ca.US.008.03.1.1]|uniref:hypothetical protein n=1 Tax=Mesorhizobium sp. M7A.F.Ca.US.008.03.1.1 TaxID=2496742 RepID=UPI000FCB0FC3|nr:hypothetical protein [Mesorhizobium sp. M7A.F.Ca.US.008.03.1.1]RUW57843.1 hypothetical protein EOA16_30170 [Mesorhizobium sp. M7A.F.Ca.US.008.03.1.1]
MRTVSLIPFLAVVGFLVGCTTDQGNAGQNNKSQCAGFGFSEGTDAFANCMLQLSLKQQSQQPPDHETLVRQYRDLSMARRGDDRYPVCSASDMDAELDTSANKWVGPNCQMAPD